MRRSPRHGQRGFTLIELIVAIPISAIVVAAATAGLMQLLDSKDASAHMLTMRQVQTAGYWMSTDGLQAETVNLTPGDAVTGGFPLTLVWTNPSDDTRHTVRYTVTGAAGNLALQRQATITDIANPGTPIVSTTTVARNLTQATCGQTTQDGQTLLIFTVTAQVDQETESRIYEIKPRSLSVD
jgi:prepilin-type N-terminal cleavage/methylation domain-containing protein